MAGCINDIGESPLSRDVLKAYSKLPSHPFGGMMDCMILAMFQTGGTLLVMQAIGDLNPAMALFEVSVLARPQIRGREEMAQVESGREWEISSGINVSSSYRAWSTGLSST